ncbi:hypothetical protein [Paraburkholderia sp. UYCP14C]|uniref:hypothetical protein n=1 Tax=Paraburkholderia sp. UYCP14C TaxID=2511130 RepID=UPI001B7D52E9|nr:hypothetical protein [Paraburkholderia sp. UYCP14C]
MLLDANVPSQEIAEIVNWRRNPQGQGALAELGAMAPPWRRDYLPSDPTPYQIEDIQQHRLNRASGSSMPHASLPSSCAPRDVSPDSTALLASQSSAFFAARMPHDIANGLNQARRAAGKNSAGYTVAEITPVVRGILAARGIGPDPSMASAFQSAMSLPPQVLTSALIHKHNPQDFSGPPLPTGESVGSRATDFTHPSSYSHASGQYPPPPASSFSGSATHRTITPAPASQGKGWAAPYPPSLQASGSSTTRSIPKSTQYWRQKVVDPATGETVSKSALAQRQKVVDPATGETVSKGALAKRQKVVDPATGETVSKGALPQRQKVVDPATGETVSKSALARRQKVVDPATGETVSKGALAKRQKVVDPATGETVSKAALAQRQKRRRSEPFRTEADGNRSARAQERTENPAAAGSGRPVVALSSMQEAVSRSWNAGDRFSIPSFDGNPHEFTVTRSRHGGEEVYRGDFRLRLRGG